MTRASTSSGSKRHHGGAFLEIGLIEWDFPWAWALLLTNGRLSWWNKLFYLEDRKPYLKLFITMDAQKLVIIYGLKDEAIS
jgi:hypothetical protein